MELQVGNKRRFGTVPMELRRQALERLKQGHKATAVAAELGVHRTTLYEWRAQLEPGTKRPKAVESPREQALRREIGELQRLLGEKSLEVDFFKGALRKIEARRQSRSGSGEAASTTKSGS